MRKVEDQISYTSIMDVINSEYKDFDKGFALKHYIDRQKVIYKYSRNPKIYKRIKLAMQLREIFETRKNIHAPGVTDYKLLKDFPINRKLFSN